MKKEKRKIKFLIIVGILILLVVLGYLFVNNWNKISGGFITGNAIVANSQGMIMYYPFNGNASDISGNAFNGAVKGATLANGKMGQAYSFDGVNDYINTSHDFSASYGAPFSFSLWYKPSNITGKHGLVGKASFEYSLWQEGSGVRFVYWNPSGMNSTNVYAPNVLTLDKWSLITVTYDGTSHVMKLYIDGLEKNSKTSPITSFKDIAESTLIGKTYEYGNTQVYAQGVIDDFRIYNRTLISTEIKSIYDAANLCSNKCISYGTGVVEKPVISSFPSSCIINQNCGTALINSNAGLTSSGDYGYEFWWIYYYGNGSISETCGCDDAPSEGLEINGKEVYSGLLSNSAYNVPVLVSDNSGGIVTNVKLKVAELRQGNRSQWTLSTTNITVGYGGCTNDPGCTNTGINSSFSGANYNEYQTCLQNGSCKNWNKRTCSAGYYFNTTYLFCKLLSGDCSTNNCNGGNDTCVSQEATAPINSELNSNKQCYCGSTCFTCKQGFTLITEADGTKRCLNKTIVATCTQKGGICNNKTILTNYSQNTTLLCEDSTPCYTCNKGFHKYNNTCVNNNCSGTYPTANNGTIIGLNYSLSGSALALVWNYSRAANSTTSCLWKCIDGYHLNAASNACVGGLADCSSPIGCLNVSSLANANRVNEKCDEEGYYCYDCNYASGYNWDGSACVKEFCSSGKLWNGYKCVDDVGCSGCTYEDGSCVRDGFRIKISATGSTLGDSYCIGNNKTFASQKTDNSACDNNFECKSNYCSESKCINLAKEIEAQTSLINQIWCWLFNGFSTTSEEYINCTSGG